MSRIFTTPETEQIAKAFMHDVMVSAGVHASQRKNSHNSFNNNVDIAACQAICMELSERDFKDIDNSIRQLAGEYFQVPVVDGGDWKKLKAEGLSLIHI